jgi:hypothetical protein
MFNDHYPTQANRRLEWATQTYTVPRDCREIAITPVTVGRIRKADPSLTLRMTLGSFFDFITLSDDTPGYFGFAAVGIRLAKVRRSGQKA